MSYFFPAKKKEEPSPYKEQEAQNKMEKYEVSAIKIEEPKKEEGYAFE